MTVRDIVKASDADLCGDSGSVLRTNFTPITDFGDRLKKIVSDLRDTLHSDTLSVGLAAPQLGYNEAVAVVNMDKQNDESDDLILVNPVIIEESGQKDVKFESCMSIPHKRGNVTRRKKVRVSYCDISGEEHELEASGFLARVVMHEIDHLNGILFTDRMEESEELENTELFREHGID